MTAETLTDHTGPRLTAIESRLASVEAVLKSLAPEAHVPCQGDAGGEWVHCSCHGDEGCHWDQAVELAVSQALTREAPTL